MDDTQGWIPLSEYKAPSVPTTKLIKKYWQKAAKLLSPSDDQPYMPSDQLTRADENALRHFFPKPSYAGIATELSSTLSSALSGSPAGGPHPMFWLCLPSGDPGVLTSWAEQHNYRMLPAPDRADILAGTATLNLGSSSSQNQSQSQGHNPGGVLVVAQLENWFIRHPRGVGLVRRLLRALDEHDGPVVLSGNGFTLLFMQQLFEERPILSKALTFRPFTADRLYPWLFRNFYDGDERKFMVKDSFSGKPLFGAISSEPPPAKSVFHRIAAESRGIPWLAWAILTASLKTRKQVDPGEDGKQGQKAVRDTSAELWMHAPATRREQPLSTKSAKFILHALAIHGSLSSQHLEQVLPGASGAESTDGAGISAITSLADLSLEGFIHKASAGYAINPRAYGTVFQTLKSAGLSCPPG